MAVFDMYMSMCVHVRSRFTAPLISGFKVSKQIVFGMGSLGSIPWYLAKGNQDRKGEHTERERERERERSRPHGANNLEGRKGKKKNKKQAVVLWM